MAKTRPRSQATGTPNAGNKKRPAAGAALRQDASPPAKSAPKSPAVMSAAPRKLKAALEDEEPVAKRAKGGKAAKSGGTPK